MNNCTLIGNLTADPELRYIAKDNTPVANFTIAVEKPYSKDKAADFLKIVVFGKQAEFCSQYLSRGKKVGIVGSIETGSYEKPDGTKVYTTEIKADRVEFLTPKNQESNQNVQNIKVDDDSEDDCPF